jgi:hypothetical protein
VRGHVRWHEHAPGGDGGSERGVASGGGIDVLLF